MTNDTARNVSPLTIKLEDGSAENMGEGVFVVLQRDPDAKKVQNVVLSTQDLKTIEASQDLTVSLEDGTAEKTGDGLWVVLQRDEVAKPQNVVLSRGDLGAMLAAA